MVIVVNIIIIVIIIKIMIIEKRVNTNKFTFDLKTNLLVFKAVNNM